MCISTSSGDCGQLSLVCSGCRPRPSLPDGHPVLKSYRQLLGQRGKRSSLVSLTSEFQSVSVIISTIKKNTISYSFKEQEQAMTKQRFEGNSGRFAILSSQPGEVNMSAGFPALHTAAQLAAMQI